MRLFRIALGALTLMSLVSAAIDCHTPQTRQQRVVCRTPDLLELDRQLSVVFQETLSLPGAKTVDLNYDQKSWEISSGGCWEQIDCLKKRYLDRIASLRTRIAAAAQGPVPPPSPGSAPTPQANHSTDFNSRLRAIQERQKQQGEAEEARRAAQSAEFNARLQSSRKGIGEQVDARQQQGQDDDPVATKQRFDEAQAKATAEANHRLAEARSRYDELTNEKQSLMAFLKVFESMGPMPTLEATVARGSRRRGGSSDSDSLDESSAKIEQQLPTLRAEAAKRQERAIAYAQQVLRRCTGHFAAAIELETLIADSASREGTIKAFDAAKKLEAAINSLAATKQRAERAVSLLRGDVAEAAKVPGEGEISAAARSASHTATELSARAKSNDPNDEPNISALTSRLEAQHSKLNRLVREKTILTTSLGKRVYEGCLASASRAGLGTASGIRVFKDEAANKSADLAVNQGTHMCRCMAAEIAGDRETTDEAKLEIARQFSTRTRMNDVALATVVAVAGGKCQLQLVDDLSGGQLSGGR